jgi:tetratricopeptide (TPR) repeat protein
MPTAPIPLIEQAVSAPVVHAQADHSTPDTGAKTSEKSKAAQHTKKTVDEPTQAKTATPLEAPEKVAIPTTKEVIPSPMQNGVAPSEESLQVVGQRQLAASREAQAQAQALWSAGSHDAAVDLLQDAVASAQRSLQSGQGPAGASNGPALQALSALARDLARMQLAQGRPGASADMLARLEPLLSGDAEIWATRGNAAQRAGRHQDSVKAYTNALQMRPNESRWLLGAAVSWAALGQTSNAATLVEKAAALGPIPKDVMAYLRQAGVPLKE